MEREKNVQDGRLLRCSIKKKYIIETNDKSALEIRTQVGSLSVR